MTDNRRKLVVPPQGGMMRSFVNQLKLIGRLMGDPRVSMFLKVLPVASVAYWLLPLPLDNVIPIIDDAAVLWIGSTLFVQLCPDDVVKEHMDDLDMIAGSDDDVVDADSKDVNDK